MNYRPAVCTFDDSWDVAVDLKKTAAVEAKVDEHPVAPIGTEEFDELLKSDPARIEGRAREVLARQASDPDARMLLGLALRRQRHLQDATAILEPLAQSHPHLPWVWGELGLAWAELGERPGALDALLRAVD